MNELHLAEPTEDGRHPEHPHLVLFEVDLHHGMLILRSPAAPGATELISWEDWDAMVGCRHQADCGFAYLVDDYLDILSAHER